MSPDGVVYTIGHSTHPIEAFLSLLTRCDVSAIADVRSVPASRFNPQFNRDPLTASLKRLGMEYVFLGQQLGARSSDRSCYVGGKVQYDRLAQSPAFQSGIERIVSGRVSHRIAVMCSEGEPLDCHRTVLVAEQLVSRGIPVTHILSDGQLELHEETRTRLRGLHGLAEADLFHSVDELTAEALNRQEDRIAYVDSDLQSAVAD